MKSNKKLKRSVFFFISSFLITSLFMGAFISFKEINLSELNNKKNNIELENPKISNINLTWTKFWNYSNLDFGFDINLDKSNNIYVVGESIVSGKIYDAILLKFNTTGALKWNKSFGGVNVDQYNGIAFDSLDNIYVMGYTKSYGSGLEDVLLSKYNPLGALLWNITWGNNYSNIAYDIAIDQNDYIYVVGCTNETHNGKDFEALLIKFDSSGNQQWNITWGGNDVEELKNIVIDNSGNLYITGKTKSYGKGNEDVLLLKYDNTGTLIWNESWGGIYKDEGSGISLDANEDIYIVGYTESFGAGSSDVVVLKYNSNGNLIWNITWGNKLTKNLVKLGH
ncbi:MAG: SBBP repeat-containing protein [Candidatus Helarchaeota archaeon]